VYIRLSPAEKKKAADNEGREKPWMFTTAAFNCVKEKKGGGKVFFGYAIANPLPSSMDSSKKRRARKKKEKEKKKKGAHAGTNHVLRKGGEEEKDYDLSPLNNNNGGLLQALETESVEILKWGKKKGGGTRKRKKGAE